MTVQTIDTMTVQTIDTMTVQTIDTGGQFRTALSYDSLLGHSIILIRGVLVHLAAITTAEYLKSNWYFIKQTNIHHKQGINKFL